MAVYLFGDGDLQGAATWSVRQTVLAVLPFDTVAKLMGTTLAVSGCALTGDTLRVTLLESPEVAPVGVGEGTWPTMRDTLREMGVSEA